MSPKVWEQRREFVGSAPRDAVSLAVSHPLFGQHVVGEHGAATRPGSGPARVAAFATELAR